MNSAVGFVGRPRRADNRVCCASNNAYCRRVRTAVLRGTFVRSAGQVVRRAETPSPWRTLDRGRPPCPGIGYKGAEQPSRQSLPEGRRVNRSPSLRGRRATIRHKLWVVGSLVRWMAGKQVGIVDLSEQRVEEFLSARRRRGRTCRGFRRTVLLLLDRLRSSGVARLPAGAVRGALASGACPRQPPLAHHRHSA